VVLLGASVFLQLGSADAGMVGLTLGYALQITTQLSWMVRQGTDTEMALNSVARAGRAAGIRARMRVRTQVERTAEYARVAPEGLPALEEAGGRAPIAASPSPPSQAAARDKLVGPGWPTSGAIELKSVSLRYRPDTPLVLRDLSVSIRGGEHVGIVGRTGAGKSSLMVLLFRITECCGGQVLGVGEARGDTDARLFSQVLVDGVDCKAVPLSAQCRQAVEFPSHS
jgi:ABC-type multidrug transport system fused ATPase/permease subunit